MKKYYLKVDRKAFLYPNELINMLDLMSEKQTYTVKILINTGARINEARHIIKKDIDFDRKNMTLVHTKVRAKLGETRPSPRKIPISTDFSKYIKRNINKHTVLSTKHTGLILKKYSKEVGVKSWKDMSAHNLRKTFGSWMLALGVDGFKLAQHLGHAPDELRKSYASPDIFSEKDKMLMLNILGDLPKRMIIKSIY